LGTPGGGQPTVSVIIPCRNEERFIAMCLDSVAAADYPGDRFEVLVIDGRSEDRTREIVAQYAARYPFIRLLDNPNKITPTALNLGIRSARGDVIVRMDAHVEYPPLYIAQLVAALEETGADNVGSVLSTLPADDTPMARAIAIGMSHPAGVGNSYFRIGTSRRRWVDTIAFFCCRKELFQRIGMFDEELVRHQDGEFNARLIKHGGRILLLPDVVAYYYARGTLRQVARMFFQYGYFKPIVAKKLGRFMTFRQLIPPLFVISVAGSAALGVWWPLAAVACGVGLGVYAALVLTCALPVGWKHGWRCGTAFASVLPTMHFSYGVGFLRQVIELFLRPRKRALDAAQMPLSR